MPTFISRSIANICILLGLLCILYIPVFNDLLRAWATKPQSSHGYLVIPICLYIVYSKKTKFYNVKLDATNAGLVFIGAGIFFYLLGSIGKISTISNISLLLNIFGILISIGGWELARSLLFPVLFLAFMFPIPDAIYIGLTAPLKIFTSFVSVETLQFFGFPILREGNIIQFPNMSLEIVEACSGLRSLTGYLIIGILLAYMMKTPGRLLQAVTVSLSIPISIFVNIIRIVLTGVLAMYWGTETAMGFFHDFSGIIVFIFGLTIYFVFYYLIQTYGSLLFGENK